MSAEHPHPAPSVRRRLTALALATGLALGGTAMATPAGAVGKGPNHNPRSTVNTSILTTHAELVAQLQKEDARQDAMELTVIGQSVKGRDIHLASWISDPENPTILFLTQQHGNEQLTTEGAMAFIKSLGTGKMRSVLDDVNVLVVPMANPDGAMGDVDFSLEDYIASGDRNLTRYNANEVDLNRDHVAKTQPETRALHENVLGAYDIDYMIDLHHQARGRLLTASWSPAPSCIPRRRTWHRTWSRTRSASARSSTTPSSSTAGATWADTWAARRRPSHGTASRPNTGSRRFCSRCAACPTTSTRATCSASVPTDTSSSRRW
ncbi:hypothetical protein E4A41_04550 [Micrococcus endophyticus]|nr:hypothetical protein E4A41_04550 [Micrococcus endophyticus]